LNEFKSSYLELKDSLSHPTIIAQQHTNLKIVSENNILQNISNKETNKMEIEYYGNQNHGNHIVGAIPGGKFVVYIFVYIKKCIRINIHIYVYINSDIYKCV
jgi:hypothetical protein